MPIVPDNVTATWCHAPVDRVELQLICCSLPPPFVVMANRGVLFQPFCGVRNMFVVVLLPKSKIRLQLETEFRLSQAMMVKLLKAPTMPAGRLTYCCEPDESANWPPESVPLLGNEIGRASCRARG